MVFIYYLEDHPVYAPLVQPLFESLEKGSTKGITSVITLLEILVKPKRVGDREAVRDYLDFLTTYPHLTIVEVDLELVDMASDLRAKYAVRTPDALQVASALRAGATGFITNDPQLKRVTELEVLLLKELKKE